jgi:hypothetical protein
VVQDFLLLVLELQIHLFVPRPRLQCTFFFEIVNTRVNSLINLLAVSFKQYISCINKICYLHHIRPLIIWHETLKLTTTGKEYINLIIIDY